MGTDYTCPAGCKWDICIQCFRKLRHEDVKLQRLAAEALFAMGAKAVQTCQVYLARSIDDADEEVRDLARKALEMAGCVAAAGGSMCLYDVRPSPCNLPSCALCKSKAMPMLEGEVEEDEQEKETVAPEDDKEEKADDKSSQSGLSEPDADATAPPPVESPRAESPKPETQEPDLLEPELPKPETPKPETPKPGTPKQRDPWGPPERTAPNALSAPSEDPPEEEHAVDPLPNMPTPQSPTETETPCTPPCQESESRTPSLQFAIPKRRDPWGPAEQVGRGPLPPKSGELLEEDSDMEAAD